MRKLLIVSVVIALTGAAQAEQTQPTDPARVYGPLPVPDRIILTWTADPATTQAVTWRTDTTVNRGEAQIAPASAAPGRGDLVGFTDRSQTIAAVTTPFESDLGPAHYHCVEFDGLRPDTLYAYRVGGEGNWSEWFHFRTAGERPEPFSFVYFGDAQNDIKAFWSRVVRGAFAHAGDIRFFVHAGDLINRANSDQEWGEWFYAAGFINGMRPSVPAAGNHEYFRDADERRRISHHWRPQFALPDNGPQGLEESVYYIDYQGVRFVVLNSNERVEEQAAWLDAVLRDNPQPWTIVTFHHPIYSSSRGRDNEALRDAWMPVFDKHRVDLVLQGHDHTYGRTGNVRAGVNVRDDESGTVYVVSVSGPKMYAHSNHKLMRRKAEDIQLYQIITIDGPALRYRAYTATDDLYDAFDLLKRDDGANELIEKGPPTPESRRAE